MSENLTSQTDNAKQAFESIKREINEAAETSISEILKNAEATKKEILASAKTEAEKVEKDILSAAEAAARQNKLREVSRKKLSANMDYLKLREEVIEGILVETRAEIQKFTKSEKYSSYLKSLLEESASAVGGGELEIKLRKEDKSILSNEDLTSIAAKVSKSTNETKFSVSKSNLAGLGGIQLSRKDGKISVDNTFESRLTRRSEDIRVAILNELK